MNSENIKDSTILIIDDNATNLSVLFNYLSGYGFTVLLAQDGESALEQIEVDKPDLILLDIMMPGIDGFETCRRLKQNKGIEDIPTIFMTALSNTADKVKGFNFGAVDYITKPFKHEEILARIKTHLTIQNLRKNLQQKNANLQKEIAERRNVEKQLQRYAARLAQSNEELQQFANIASHDLQEPLRTVISYLRLLARRYQGKLDVDADDFIGYAVDGANRMQKLINDLLAYSRVSTGDTDFKPTDCEVVLNHCIDNLQIVVKESKARVTHAPLPTVMADDTQMEQLFQNLISNAIKFRREEPPQVHVSAELKVNK